MQNGRYLLLIIVFFVSIQFASGQKYNRCAAYTKLEEAMLLDVDLKNKVEQSKLYYKNTSNLRIENTYSKLTIPVAVHVLYNNTTQNISDAQIRSQIDVLNRDFGAKNADSLPSSHPFHNLFGNANIEFCLASTKPDGSATTGIERKSINKSGFEYSTSDENYIKSTTNGGLNAWNTAKYLNIWVVNFTDNTLGYATFPDELAGNKDGLVIGYKYFGTVGVLEAPYDKGRTTTHEIGHWLGLYHIWGDEAGCSVDDEISDTPLQDVQFEDCSCEVISDNCSPSIMYQNYMDYTEDACMALFTKGQVAKMRSVLSTENNRKTFLINTVGCNTHTPTIDNNRHCSLTSNSQNFLDYGIKVFPNPVINVLHIEKLPPSNSNYEIKILNSLGAEVLSKQVNINQTSIDISELGAGLYFLNISNYKLKTSTMIQVIK